MEHTFVLIKPDGVQLGHAGQIICKLDKKGFTLKGLKMITLDRTFAKKHYQHLSDNPYLSRIINYIISGPVVAMIWEGKNVVLTAREIIEETIRPDSVLERVIGSNLVHGSDSVESAYKEIALWFPDEPVEVHSDAATPIARDIGRISAMEQTLILIMPDGMKSRLVGQTIRLFDEEGFTLKGLKMITVDQPLAENLWSANAFFPQSISPGPVVAMIWEGNNVVNACGDIIRMTIPSDDMDMDIDCCCNLIHWSDSVESAIQEIALWFPDGPVKLHSDASIPKAREIGRISVTRFVCDRPRKHLKRALREHYSSCGKITDVYVDKKSRLAIIYLVGEDAVDKALKLNGCEVGGWKLCAKANPFRDDKPVSVTVEGYASSLDDKDLERELRVLFSSCGTVRRVCKLTSCAVVTIRGFDAAEKALELGGSTIGRRKVLVKEHTEPPRYTVHDRRVQITRRQRFAVHDRRGRVQK